MSTFGIVFLTIIIAIPILGALFGGYDIEDRIEVFFGTLCLELISLLGLGLLLLIISSAIETPNYVEKTESKELVSFGNNSAVKGHFSGGAILGCGGMSGDVNNEQYYFYYTKENDGLKFHKVYLNDDDYEVYLNPYKDNNATAQITYYKRANKNVNIFDKIFLKKERIIEKYKEADLRYQTYKVIFNVPENSIIYTNSIDTNKF